MKLFDLTNQINEIKNIVELLLAINFKRLSLLKCFRSTNISSFSNDDNSDDENSNDENSIDETFNERIFNESASTLRLRAEIFVQTISTLSHALIRFRWENSVFICSIIDFVALHVINSNEFWIAIKNLFFRLSEWIHCMQLWLLSYSIVKLVKSTSFKIKLQKIVRRQRIKYLINIAFNLISKLSCWRLFTWKTNNDTIRHSIIIINVDCMQISHQNVNLNLTQWRQNISAMIHSINVILENDLLLNLHETSLYSVSNLIDNYFDNKFDKFFLDDSRNQLNAIRDWLYKRVQSILILRRKFFKANVSLRIRQFKINSYLLAVQRFLRLLSVLMYQIFDLSSRRKELIDATWCNQEIARNLYLSHKLMIVVNDYHKIAWKVDFRLIARFLLSKMNELLMRYLIYVSSFVFFLCTCMQYWIDREHLFEKREQIWIVDQFDTVMKRQITLTLSFVIIIKQYRHMFVCVDKRLLRNLTCKMYEISKIFNAQTSHATHDSNSNCDDDFEKINLSIIKHNKASRIHVMQTNHTAFINRMIYDNDVDLFFDLTNELLANYLKISSRWHEKIVQLHAIRSVSEIHKRLFSRDLISIFFKRQNRDSNLKIRSELWIWLVIEHCMKQLFDSQTKSRNMNQRNELLMIARNRSKMLVMMFIDSDKILLFVILSQLSRAKIIIVIVSLIALKQDLQERCKQWDIHCMSYDFFFIRNQLHAISSLFLVNIENVVISDFVEFAQTLHVNDRLNRIVLNEIHQLLIINHYR